MKKLSRKRRGFTLIELMTATSIMVVLIMFVTNIAVDMLRAYDRTISALATNSDARTALDPMEEDLSSAKMFQDGHVWFEARFEGDVGNIEAASAPEIMVFAQSRDRVRRRPSTGNQQLPGDLCAISYKLVQKSPFGDSADSPENQVYGIYRAVLNAEDTLKVALPYILGADGKAENEEEQIPSKFWTSSEQITDPSDEEKYSPKTWLTGMQNFLADGIVNLTLIFWYDDFTDGKRKIAAVNNPHIVSQLRQAYPGYTVTTFQKSILAKSDYVIFDDNFSGKKSGALRAVDISITVLGPDGKERLMGLQRQSGSAKIDTEKFEEVIREFGVTFVRSFSLFNSGM